MAALATRLVGTTSLVNLSNVPASSKLLAVVPINKKAQNASIYSKSSGMLEERMKPWPYEKLGYNYLLSLVDGTTKRFNDNTKLIVIEGPPALGKTKFAEELADELDMKYVPGATMEHFYINKYGYDLRELDHLFTYEKNVSFDEKKFAQNPLGQNGGLDRMQFFLQQMRLDMYVDYMCHLFNTGQGIVTERSPFSDFVWTEAAYKMGWIARESRIYLNKVRKQILAPLLRPNLIIYLDAPVDVVQSNIRARAQTTHPWEKNSPVFENTEYLKLVYDEYMKKDYIKNAASSSRVLMYDWSEGGDTEVVVEDIERLNMDYFDKYDKQQKDWRLFKEDEYARKRCEFTSRTQLMWNLRCDYLDHDRIISEPAEAYERLYHSMKVPGSRYRVGYNEEMGDSVHFRPEANNPVLSSGVYYGLDFAAIDNDDWKNYWRLRQLKRAAGEAKWWQF